MITQKITRLSVTGSNAEIVEMAPNVWMVVYHDIDINLKASMYVGMYVAQTEEQAYEEAKHWLEKREEYNEKYEAL